MGIPAIVAAGEGRASRAVHGRNKAFLEIEGRSLLARVVATLQCVPEVSEVWVVGLTDELEKALDQELLRSELRKPLTLAPQYRNLMENAWETYRRLLPGASPDGRDPTPEEEEIRVLYLSSDLPLATPQEISSFIQRSRDVDCDYAVGLVEETSMTPFYPEAGQPGIHIAYFNINEGRFRQSNLHLVKPARIGNRQHIQNMYQHRYQKQLGNALSLAWTIATDEGGGLWMIWYYVLMHLAGIADRRGWRRLSDWLRGPVTFPRVERACGKLLKTRFRFVTTDVGGCAVDIDTEEDLATVLARFDGWQRQQAERAEELHGPLPLPATTGKEAVVVRVLSGPGRLQPGERSSDTRTPLQPRERS